MRPERDAVRIMSYLLNKQRAQAEGKGLAQPYFTRSGPAIGAYFGHASDQNLRYIASDAKNDRPRPLRPPAARSGARRQSATGARPGGQGRAVDIGGLAAVAAAARRRGVRRRPGRGPPRTEPDRAHPPNGGG